MGEAIKKKKIFDNRYEILSIVGRGKRSVVYHARYIDGDKEEVALKVILQDKDGVPPSDLLRKEALAMVSSRHKYVIRLDDFHSLGEICYLTMEYAGLGDLRKYLATRNGKLSPTQVELFLLQAGEALDFVHKAGILHRDLKPENILVIDDQNIRIGDFGVAILPGEKFSLEELQKGIGTLDYLSPEVLEGKQYDKRSDLYALGVTFYELLSGKHPFSEASLIDQVDVRRNGSFTSIHNHAPEAPAHLLSAIHRLMNFDPERRFQSAREMIQALISFEVSDSGATTPPNGSAQINGSAHSDSTHSNVSAEIPPPPKRPLRALETTAPAVVENQPTEIPATAPSTPTTPDQIPTEALSSQPAIQQTAAEPIAAPIAQVPEQQRQTIPEQTVQAPPTQHAPTATAAAVAPEPIASSTSTTAIPPVTPTPAETTPNTEQQINGQPQAAPQAPEAITNQSAELQLKEDPSDLDDELDLLLDDIDDPISLDDELAELENEIQEDTQNIPSERINTEAGTGSNDPTATMVAGQDFAEYAQEAMAHPETANPAMQPTPQAAPHHEAAHQQPPQQAPNTMQQAQNTYQEASQQPVSDPYSSSPEPENQDYQRDPNATDILQDQDVSFSSKSRSSINSTRNWLLTGLSLLGILFLAWYFLSGSGGPQKPEPNDKVVEEEIVQESASTNHIFSDARPSAPTAYPNIPGGIYSGSATHGSTGETTPFTIISIESSSTLIIALGTHGFTPITIDINSINDKGQVRVFSQGRQYIFTGAAENGALQGTLEDYNSGDIISWSAQP